jgi:hypothetical protein
VMVFSQDDGIKLLVKITTMLHKYMHIYLWITLRIVVFFARGIYGILHSDISICIYTYGPL